MGYVPCFGTDRGVPLLKNIKKQTHENYFDGLEPRELSLDAADAPFGRGGVWDVMMKRTIMKI